MDRVGRTIVVRAPTRLMTNPMHDRLALPRDVIIELLQEVSAPLCEGFLIDDVLAASFEKMGELSSVGTRPRHRYH